MTSVDTPDNPLLTNAPFPAFDRIEPSDVVPAIGSILRDAQARLEQLETQIEPTWAGLLRPLAELDVLFERSWGAVSHLFGVKNSDALRSAYEEVLGDVVAFGLRVSQSEPIYTALKSLKQSAAWEQLCEAQQRIVDAKLLTAELAGVGLADEQRQRFCRCMSDRELPQGAALLPSLPTMPRALRSPPRAAQLGKRNPGSVCELSPLPPTGCWQEAFFFTLEL